MKLLKRKVLAGIALVILGSQSLEAYTTKETFARYPNKYFVESGSWVGGGIENALAADFKHIYSIELKQSLYEYCSLKFASFPFVKLFVGDSAEILPLILEQIDAPATFWLDGHYCGSNSAKGASNTPLLAELEHISQHPIKTHTILIDDIRQFGTAEMDYITLEMVIEKLRSINPDYEILFEDGYIPGDVLVAVVRK